VLINEGRSIGGKKGQLIEEQTGAMKQQIDHYLQRARMAAQRGSVVFRAPVDPVLERMVRVMAKLNPEIDISLARDNDIRLCRRAGRSGGDHRQSARERDEVGQGAGARVARRR
jgi:hypothetical protein